MITDTQWLLRALVAELEQAGIADDVAAPNVTTYDAALDASGNTLNGSFSACPARSTWSMTCREAIPSRPS